MLWRTNDSCHETKRGHRRSWGAVREGLPEQVELPGPWRSGARVQAVWGTEGELEEGQRGWHAARRTGAAARSECERTGFMPHTPSSTWLGDSGDEFHPLWALVTSLKGMQ